MGQGSSTSSRPPSADSPYSKPKRQSGRRVSGRKPGKQPGAPGSTLCQVDEPDRVVVCEPDRCAGCGSALVGAELPGVARRQVLNVPAAPPRAQVTEYQVAARRCACGMRTAGRAPRFAGGPVQYGPELAAQAANIVCGHYVPVGRAAALLAATLGAVVSTGFVAGVRPRAARALEETFLPRVRELLRSAGVLHVDETPGRADGHLEYVHVACTEFLTAMHTGRRSSKAIDAGEVLPGYAGVLVRDGYAGYAHLLDAVHAWCGAHLLRDLRAFHQADPAGQLWARAMADTLLDAHHAAQTARTAGKDTLDEPVLARILATYRGAVAKGLSDNRNAPAGLRRDALTLARRFQTNEDMILAIRHRPDRAVYEQPGPNGTPDQSRSSKRTSGGCWRTLQGLADFAVVQSYLSTASEWGLDKLDVLRQLFTTGPWLPPALAPG